jgi:hypothetical protein
LCAAVCISPACFDRAVEVDIKSTNNTVETTNVQSIKENDIV